MRISPQGRNGNTIKRAEKARWGHIDLCQSCWLFSYHTPLFLAPCCFSLFIYVCLALFSGVLVYCFVWFRCLFRGFLGVFFTSFVLWLFRVFVSVQLFFFRSFFSFFFFFYLLSFFSFSFFLSFFLFFFLSFFRSFSLSVFCYCIISILSFFLYLFPVLFRYFGFFSWFFSPSLLFLSFRLLYNYSFGFFNF